MCLILVYCVIYCGVTQTRLSKVFFFEMGLTEFELLNFLQGGLKTIVVSLSHLDLILFPISSKNMI